jgi:hypothetical protein
MIKRISRNLKWLVLRGKEEGGDWVLLLYLCSITHLQTHECSCRNTKSRLTLVKRLIKWYRNMHIRQITRLILRGKLTPFPRTSQVVALKRRHQLTFVPHVWNPTLSVALNTLLEISKSQVTCKLRFVPFGTFAVVFLFCLNTRNLKSLFVVFDSAGDNTCQLMNRVT